MVKKDIMKIVLTGGPCGGKTTALAYVCEKLSDAGFYPVFVPEAATLLMSSHITPVNGVFSSKIFQECVLRMILSLEEQMEFAAKNTRGNKVVLICDRGIMDTKAYVPEHEFWRLMKKFNLDISDACDGRYVGVFHLRTAACGAEDFYTTANNVVRRENLEEAREKDALTENAWVGHPHFRVIENNTGSFEGKLHRLYQSICRVVGIPVPLEIERKYLVQPFDLKTIPSEYEVVDIEQIYIEEPTRGNVDQLRIRKRGSRGAYTYFETMKKEVRPGVRVETERFITKAEYEWSKRYAKHGKCPINKQRVCFVYEGQYFELDVFAHPRPGLHLLEIELTEENDRISLPPFIPVLEDVTGKSEYSNWEIASF